MKNSPNTKYVLIGLAVLIWGLIIYKVVSGLSGDDISEPQQVHKPLVKSNIDTTYRLLADNYADPFFNEIEIEADTIIETQPLSEPVNTLPATHVPPVTQAPIDPQPAVKYNGYIYNPATRKRTALITYNGRTMVVGVADKLDKKTKIVKINDIELVISFNGKIIVIGVAGS